MKNIFKVDELDNLEKLLKDKKTVLVGGCFDVIHLGHIIFLEKAKKAGDILIVLLEPDEKIKQLKGVNRPVHVQADRAKVLTSLRFVDYVIILPFLTKEEEYDQLIFRLKPNVIAATYGGNAHYARTAKFVKSKLKYVTKMVGNYSSSKILGR